jgi:hypothetical protein
VSGGLPRRPGAQEQWRTRKARVMVTWHTGVTASSSALGAIRAFDKVVASTSGCNGFAGVAQLQQAVVALALGVTGRDGVAGGLGAAGTVSASQAGAWASRWWRIWVGPQLHSGCVGEEKQHIFASSLSSIAKCLATSSVGTRKWHAHCPAGGIFAFALLLLGSA